MALDQNYYELWFESFRLKHTGGHISPIQLKLVPGQAAPPEVARVCAARGQDPFALLTECSKDLFNNYPVGTKFLIKAKVTDKEGSSLFFYTYYRWKPLEIRRPG